MGGGADSPDRRPPQRAQAARCLRLEREAGDLPYAERSAAGVSGVPTPDYRKQCLAAQPAAGAAQRRRRISRCADRSAAGCAARRTLCGAQRSKENHAQGDTAGRVLAAWHEAELQPGGDGGSAAALTRSRLPRCLRPATDPRRRASGQASASAGEGVRGGRAARAPAVHASPATASQSSPRGDAATRPLQCNSAAAPALGKTHLAWEGPEGLWSLC